MSIKSSQIGGNSLKVLLLVAFWIELILMLWGASFGSGLRAMLLDFFMIDDKMLHAISFMILTFTALAIWRPAWVVVLGLILLAVNIEVVQIILPERTGSIKDFSASAAGIGVAWSFVHVLNTIRTKHYDSNPIE